MDKLLQTKPEICKTLKAFMIAQFINRNSDESIKYLCKNINWYGTSEREDVHNIDEANSYCKQEISVFPEAYFLETFEEEENIYSPDVRTESLKCKMTGGEVTVTFRATATVCKEEDKDKILNLHMSIPTIEQKDDEFFPFSLEKKYENELKKELLSKSISGGLLCSYDEPNFPLYLVNQQLLNYLGYKNEDEFKKTINGLVINCIYVDDRENNKKQAIRQLENSEYYIIEYRMIRKDGSLIWVEDKGKIISSDEGRNIIIGILSDITKKKELQEELEKKAEKAEMLDRLFNTASSGIFRLNIKNRFEIEYANETYFSIMGYTREQFKDEQENSIINIIYPEDREMVKSEIQKLSMSNRSNLEIEFKIKKRTKKIIWAHASCSVLKDANKNQILVGILTDITKEKDSKNKLTESEQTLAVSIRDSGMDCWQYDMRHNRVIMSESLQKKYSVPEVLENYPESWLALGFIHPDDCELYRNAVLKLRNGQEKVVFECRTRNSFNPEYVWRNVKMTTIFDSYNKPIKAVATAQNVDDYKHLEKKFWQTISQNSLTTWEPDIKHKKIIYNKKEVGKYLKKFPMLIEGAFSDVFFEGEIPFVHPDDKKQCIDQLNRVIKGERQVIAQFRTYSIEANCYEWVEVIYTIIEDEDGKPKRALATSRNIQPEKLLEMQYIEEQDLRRQLDESLVATCTVNLTKNKLEDLFYRGKSIYTPEMESLVDYKERMSLIMSDVSLSDEGSKTLSPKELLTQFGYGIRNFSKEYYAMEKNSDQPLRLKVDCHMVIRPSSEDVIAVFYNRDYTIQHINEIITRSIMETRLSLAGLIFAKSKLAYLLWSDKKFDRTNIKAMHYDEAIKSFCSRITPSGDLDALQKNISCNQVEFICSQLEKSETYNYTLNAVDLSGKSKIYQLSYSYADRTHGIICVARTDITSLVNEEKEKQKQLEEALRVAEKANSAKSDFLSTISHEIRTPLNVIIGMMELVKRCISDPNMVRDYLAKMDTASHHLLNLINNILDMSKIEHGGLELHLEPTGRNVFDSYMNMVIRPMCEEKKIKLITSGIGPDVNVLMDKLRFNQVMFNLISNSIKFTPENGTIYFARNYNIKDNKLVADYQIADTGIGMSEEFQRKLFMPFSQESNEVVSSIQGTGLGLSLAKGIIDKMGGTITCDSKKGQGTTFFIHLEYPFTNQQVSMDTYESNENISFEGKTIMLVEDHPMNRLISQRLLAEKGANIILAENGQEAVEKFEKSEVKQIDAILMDIRMPIMDGLEASKTIRNLKRKDSTTVPIIAMTANAYDSDRQKSLDAGMNYHLSKPIEPDKLYHVLNIFLHTQTERSASLNKATKEAENVNQTENLIKKPIIDEAPTYYGFAKYSFINDKLKIKYCSPEVSSLAGVSVEEYMNIVNNQGETGIYAPDEVRVLKSINETIQNNRLSTIKFRIKHVQGGIIWVETQIFYLGKINGEDIIVAIFKALEETKNQYRNLIVDSTQPILISDFETHEILFANKKVFEFFGKNKHNYRGKTCYQLFFDRNSPCEECKNGTISKGGCYHDHFIYGDLYFNREAQKIKWNGRNAVVETMSNITSNYADTERVANDFNAILRAFRLASAMVFSVNLTKNNFHIIEYDTFKSKKFEKSGTYDDMILDFAGIVHTDEKEIFINTYVRANLISAYNRGENYIHLRHKQMTDEGLWQWVDSFALFLPTDRSNDVREITFVIPSES